MASVQCGILTHKSQINASLHRYGFPCLIPNHKKSQKIHENGNQNYWILSFDCIQMHLNHLNVH